MGWKYAHDSYFNSNTSIPTGSIKHSLNLNEHCGVEKVPFVAEKLKEMMFNETFPNKE